MKTRIRPFLISVAITAMLAGLSYAQIPPTNVRMQNVVKAFVQRTGQQVIGLGSWISGTNYNDVLTGGASDHDLRLVIQRSGVTPAQAQQEWQSARRVLTEMINQEFGKDANKILGVTNLYPPNQLMKGVEGAADAMQRFQKLGRVPNLGFAGTVNANTPSKFAEGLYGEGAQVWTQMYEQKSGRLFYAADGKVFAGMVDLTHLEEGKAKYSSGGMLNTGVQWMEHAEEELSLNRGDRVAKYLERLDRDLAKAKDMVRLGGDPSLTAEIRDLSQRLKANPAALGSIEGRVTALLARSHMESAILGRLAKSGPIEGAVLKSAMAGIAAKNQFGQALTTAAQNIPVEELIHGVIAIVVVKSASSTAGEAGYLEALRKESPVLASLPVGILMGLTNEILDAAKSGGYSLVASYQDPWELLEGNFTAAGRVSVDEGRPYTLNELVKAIHTEERLSNFVHTRSVQAADRGFKGAVSSGTDSAAAAAIYERCYPPILRAWQTRREQLRMEYLDAADRLQRTVFPIVVTPASAKLPKGGKVDVTAELLPPKDSTLGRDLDRMKGILTWLNGGSPYALVTYKWVGGTSGARETQQNYTFNQGGTQPIVCNVEIVVNESRLQAGDPLIQRVRRFSAVDVEIEGEKKIADAYNIWFNFEVKRGNPDPFPRSFTWQEPGFHIPTGGMRIAPGKDGSFAFQIDEVQKYNPFSADGWAYNERHPKVEAKGLIDTVKETITIDGKWTSWRKATTSENVELSQNETGTFKLSGSFKEAMADAVKREIDLSQDSLDVDLLTECAWNGTLVLDPGTKGRLDRAFSASGNGACSGKTRLRMKIMLPTEPAQPGQGPQPSAMPAVRSSSDKSTNTKETDDLLKQGAAFAVDKKYDEALKTFDKALSIDPDNAEAMRQRGVAKRELKDLPGALEDFNSTIRLDPKNERAYVGRGITKERMKDVPGALADYELAINQNPKYVNGYFYHGLLKLNQKDYQASIADYDRVIELEPANSGAHNNRGLAKAGAGNTAGAIADYEKAIALNPNDEIAKKNLAAIRPATKPEVVEHEIFSTGNDYGVANGGTPPSFVVKAPTVITQIMTYHWNNGRGTPGGTIALRDANGKTYGPWNVSVRAKVYWEVNRKIELPPGTYTVIDSEPSTWAQNAASGGKGMVTIKGL